MKQNQLIITIIFIAFLNNTYNKLNKNKLNY